MGREALRLDMAKQAVRVGSIELRVKRVTGKKRVILSGLKNGFGLIGLLVRSTHIFLMNFYFYFFIFIKKTTCIFHLESYATNYLCKMHYFEFTTYIKNELS